MNSQNEVDHMILEKTVGLMKTGKSMRDAQKVYFKNKLSADLQKSKQWEARFDRELAALGNLLREARADGFQIPLFEPLPGPDPLRLPQGGGEKLPLPLAALGNEWEAKIGDKATCKNCGNELVLHHSGWWHVEGLEPPMTPDMEICGKAEPR